MGNPDLAVPSLRALNDAFRIVLVVTNPDRPAGRKRRLQPPPVKHEAKWLGVPVFQPETTRTADTVSHIASFEPEFLVVFAYGEILRPALLDVPSRVPLNAHASLLPRHRGPSPVASAILAGDSQTGISIMRMTERMDEGPVYTQEAVPVEPEDNVRSLEKRLAPVAAELLVSAIKDITAGTAEERPQEGEPSYSRIVSKQDGLIDWSRPAADIERMTRAYDPWPTAYTFFTDKKDRRRRLRVFRAAVISAEDPGGERVPRTPGAEKGSSTGMVLDAETGRLLISTGEGAIEALEVQTEGSRRMTAEEFLRGHPIAPGTRLG